MKFRLTLVALIVAAQLGWIAFDYLRNTAVLADSPSVIIPADFPSYCGQDIAPADSFITLELKPDNPRLGKSIWWTVEGVKDAQPVTLSRPAPGAEVQGAVELHYNHAHYNITYLKGGKEIDRDDYSRTFSVIWSKGPDGVWDYRLEARGSTEDKLREGELRTLASCSYSFGSSSEMPRLRMYLFGQDGVRYHHTPEYRITGDSRRIFEEWLSSTDRKPQYTMEVALRENDAPLATQFYVDGRPWGEVIRDIKQGDYTQPPAAPQADAPQPPATPAEPAAEPTPEPPAEAPADTAEPPAPETTAESTPTAEQPAEPEPSSAEPAPAAEPPAETAADTPAPPAENQH